MENKHKNLISPAFLGENYSEYIKPFINIYNPLCSMRAKNKFCDISAAEWERASRALRGNSLMTRCFKPEVAESTESESIFLQTSAL